MTADLLMTLAPWGFVASAVLVTAGGLAIVRHELRRIQQPWTEAEREEYAGRHRPDAPRVPGTHRLGVAPGCLSQRAHWELPTKAWAILDSADPWPTDPDGRRALAPGWRRVPAPQAAEVLGARGALPQYAHGSDEDLLAVARETGVAE